VAAPNHRTPHAPNHYSDTLQGLKETTILLHNPGQRLAAHRPRGTWINSGRRSFETSAAPSKHPTPTQNTTPIVEQVIISAMPAVDSVATLGGISSLNPVLSNMTDYYTVASRWAALWNPGDRFSKNLMTIL